MKNISKYDLTRMLIGADEDASSEVLRDIISDAIRLYKFKKVLLRNNYDSLYASHRRIKANHSKIHDHKIGYKNATTLPFLKIKESGFGWSIIAAYSGKPIKNILSMPKEDLINKNSSVYKKMRASIIPGFGPVGKYTTDHMLTMTDRAIEWKQVDTASIESIIDKTKFPTHSYKLIDSRIVDMISSLESLKNMNDEDLLEYMSIKNTEDPWYEGVKKINCIIAYYNEILFASITALGVVMTASSFCRKPSPSMALSESLSEAYSLKETTVECLMEGNIEGAIVDNMERYKNIKNTVQELYEIVLGITPEKIARLFDIRKSHMKPGSRGFDCDYNIVTKTYYDDELASLFLLSKHDPGYTDHHDNAINYLRCTQGVTNISDSYTSTIVITDEISKRLMEREDKYRDIIIDGVYKDIDDLKKSMETFLNANIRCDYVPVIDRQSCSLGIYGRYLVESLCSKLASILRGNGIMEDDYTANLYSMTIYGCVDITTYMKAVRELDNMHTSDDIKDRIRALLSSIHDTVRSTNSDTVFGFTNSTYNRNKIMLSEELPKEILGHLMWLEYKIGLLDICGSILI